MKRISHLGRRLQNLRDFSEPLASALRAKLLRLLAHEPRVSERIETHSMSAVARRLYRSSFPGGRVADCN